MDWKGLRTDVTPVFLSYDKIERMIAALLDRAMRWQPDLVVGISRGGLVPASMVAGIMALPLSMVGFDRDSGRVNWIGAKPNGSRALLVDDGCSSGRTMATAREVLLGEGRKCLTLTVVYDPDVTSYVPDLSHPMRALWRFPWERGEATPAGRSHRAVSGGPDRRTEAPFFGLELDGVLLPYGGHCTERAELNNIKGLPSAKALPFFTPERAVLVTGRPEKERPLISDWMAHWGLTALPVECRPSNVGDGAAEIARYKAERANVWGCTHFIDSQAEVALRISANAPHLLVSWWSAAESCAWIIDATAGEKRLQDNKSCFTSKE